MSKTRKKARSSDAPGVRTEYHFDYSRAKPNRFAHRMELAGFRKDLARSARALRRLALSRID